LPGKGLRGCAGAGTGAWGSERAGALNLRLAGRGDEESEEREGGGGGKEGEIPESAVEAEGEVETTSPVRERPVRLP